MIKHALLMLFLASAGFLATPDAWSEGVMIQYFKFGSTNTATIGLVNATGDGLRTADSCESSECVQLEPPYEIRGTSFTIYGNNPADAVPIRVTIGPQTYTLGPPATAGLWSAQIPNLSDGNHTISVYTDIEEPALSVNIIINTRPGIEVLAVEHEDEPVLNFLFPGIPSVGYELGGLLGGLSVDCTEEEQTCIAAETDTPTVISRSFLVAGKYYDEEPNRIVIGPETFSGNDIITDEATGTWSINVSNITLGTHDLSVHTPRHGATPATMHAVTVDTDPIITSAGTDDTFRDFEEDLVTIQNNRFSLRGIYDLSAPPSKVFIDTAFQDVILAPDTLTWTSGEFSAYIDGTYTVILEADGETVDTRQITIDTNPLLLYAEVTGDSTKLLFAGVSEEDLPGDDPCPDDSCVPTAKRLVIRSSSFTIFGTYFADLPARVDISGDKIAAPITRVSPTVWSINTGDIADGNHIISVYGTSSDAPSDTTEIRVDITPTVEYVTFDSNGDGQLDDADMRADNTYAEPGGDTMIVRAAPFTITGHYYGSTPPSHVMVGSTSTSEITTDTSDGQNTWSVTVTTPLAMGDYTIQVYNILDQEPSLLVPFTFDTNPVIQYAYDDGADIIWNLSGEDITDSLREDTLCAECAVINGTINAVEFEVGGLYFGNNVPTLLKVGNLEYNRTVIDASDQKWSVQVNLTATRSYTTSVHSESTRPSQAHTVTMDVNTDPVLLYAYHQTQYWLVPKITAAEAGLDCDEVSCHNSTINRVMIKSNSFTLYGKHYLSAPTRITVGTVSYEGDNITTNENNTWSVSIPNLADGNHRITLYTKSVIFDTIRININTVPTVQYILNPGPDKDTYWFMRGTDPSDTGVDCEDFTCHVTDGNDPTIRANTFKVSGLYFGEVPSRINIGEKSFSGSAIMQVDEFRWQLEVTDQRKLADGQYRIDLFNSNSASPHATAAFTVDTVPELLYISADDAAYLFAGVSASDISECRTIECQETDDIPRVRSNTFTIHGMHYDDTPPHRIEIGNRAYSGTDIFDEGDKWSLTIRSVSDNTYDISVLDEFSSAPQLVRQFTVDTTPKVQHFSTDDTIWLLPETDPEDIFECTTLPCHMLTLDHLIHVNSFTISGLYYGDTIPERIQVGDTSYDISTHIQTWSAHIEDAVADGVHEIFIYDRTSTVPVSSVMITIATKPVLDYMMYGDTYLLPPDPQPGRMLPCGPDECMPFGPIPSDAFEMHGTYHLAPPTGILLNDMQYSVTAANGIWSAAVSGLKSGSYVASIQAGGQEYVLVPRLVIDLTTSVTGLLSHVVGDWDGDGDTDVGSVGILSGGHHLFTLNANGTSHTTVFSGALGDASHYRTATIAPLVGDWDGDGDTDVGTVGILADSNIMHALLNADGYNYNTIYRGPIGDTADYLDDTSAPISGDWDGDGDDDIGILGVAPNNMHHYSLLVDGRPLFAGYAADASDYLAGTVQYLAGDWDGDGDTDVGISGVMHDGMHHYSLLVDGRQTATDTLGSALYHIPGTVQYLAGDWDGDGDTDVGISGISYNGMQHFLLVSGGTTVFSGFVGNASDYVPGRLGPVTGDWDGDGDTDVGAVGIAESGLQYFTLVANTTMYDPVFTTAIGDVNHYAITHDLTYYIIISNMMAGQPLTPPVVAVHDADIDIFTPGQQATALVQDLAENGAVGPLYQALVDDTGVASVMRGTFPLFGDDNTATFRFTAPADHPYLSFVSMLVCTNDGFAGLDSLLLRADMPRHVVYPAIYDAGTEVNTEDFADIVPPCQGIVGISSGDAGTDTSNRTLAEDSVISLHGGVDGTISDLTGIHGWTGLPISVEIIRVD